ncbi:MAG: exo-alpha-sialidase [Bryobacterales bacterium]|nr:exo-alpha-sialidase [Bryobacterales bacterium]
MKLRIVIFWIGLLAGLAPAGPRFSQVDIWRQGEAGVNTYRIPALVETRRGTLIAVADARHDQSSDLPGRIFLVMRRSFDRGTTWSPAQVIRKVEEGGVGDASLLLDRASGRVWCFHAYGPPGIGFPTAKPGAVTGPDTLQVHAMYSDDDGSTWSAPADITPQIKDPSWQAMFATSGTHFETSRGRYLVPMVVREGDRSVSARNAYSDDRGRTWKIGPAIGPGTDESKAVELADGTVLENMRDGKTRAVARSRDGGVSFDRPVEDTALVDPSCNAGITRYKGRGMDILVFTNAVAVRRENLSVKISYDGGRTWPEGRTIHPGPAAYSTVIVLRDGTIGVLYERGDKYAAERITFARFNLDWVRASGRTSSAEPRREQ